MHQKSGACKNINDIMSLNKDYAICMDYCERTGTTLPLYITKLKIAEAKNLLRFTDMPLSEISEHLSFSSQSYFQSVFKKETGDTPNEYRRLNKLLVVK